MLKLFNVLEEMWLLIVDILIQRLTNIDCKDYIQLINCLLTPITWDFSTLSYVIP